MMVLPTLQEEIVWGAFPSAALAWRINKENFLKEVEWLSNLKLRAGYGVVGNSNVASFCLYFYFK